MPTYNFIKKIILSISLVLILFCFTYAQKTRTATGKSQLRVEPSLSQIETEEKTIELAKIDAIINAFGEYVEQESTIKMQSGKVDFRTYGQTKVNGEWIRSITQPQISYLKRTNEGIPETWITCEIRGEIRQVTPKANLEVEVLSCPEKNCRTYQFHNNQDAFLYVKSSVDGYLSIFLDDGNTVYRLLPYQQMRSKKTVKIKGDQEYILFSRDHKNFDISADRIELTTSKEQEVNTFVVVFSETEFQKPILFEEQKDDAGYITPKSLSKINFEKWLGDNRAAFPDFLDLKTRLVIKSR